MQTPLLHLIDPVGHDTRDGQSNGLLTHSPVGQVTWSTEHA